MQAVSHPVDTTPTPFHPPTRRLAYRFFWKECRRIAGLSLGIAGIAVAVMIGIALVGPQTSRPAQMLPAQMLTIAFGGAAMLAIAAAVTLFAVEKEEGTADLLRTLPKNQAALVLGKFAAALASVLLLLMVLSLVAYIVAGGWPSGANAGVIVQQGFIAIAEALAFGMLASLVCTNPLLAAILGIFLASMNSQLAMLLFVPSSHGFEAKAMQAALPARWAFVAAIAAIDWWLGMRWLPTMLGSRTRKVGKVDDVEGVGKVAGVEAGLKPRRRWRAAFVRLVWQSVRQSWGVALAVTVIGVCLSFAFALVTRMFAGTDFGWQPVGWLGLLFTPALLGAMVFRADQRRRQYRFLSEHAGRPFALWLARIGTWMTPMAVIPGAVSVVAVLFAFDQLQSGYQYGWLWRTTRPIVNMDVAEVMSTELQLESARQLVVQAAGIFFSAAIAAFAYGQFFSIALRSDILAAMLSLAASLLIACWAAVVGLAGLSAVWFLLPLAAGALVASRLRVRDWLLERNSLVRWAAPLIALLLPIGLVLLAMPSARLAQIPDNYTIPAPGGGVIDYDLIAAEAEQELTRGREVADAYQRLASQGAEDNLGGALSDEQYEELIALSKVECRLPEAFSHYAEQGRVIQKLQAELSLPGRNYGAGDLDEQFAAILASRRIGIQLINGQTLPSGYWLRNFDQELLDWATADGQTPERIRNAIDQLKAIEQTYLGPSDRLANEYLRIRSVIRGKTAPSFLQPTEKLVTPPRLDRWLAYLANDLPGETERAERSLDVLATLWTRRLRETENLLLSDTSEEIESPSMLWRQRLLRQNVWIADAYMLALTPDASVVRTRLQLLHRAQSSYLVYQEFPGHWIVSQGIEEWVATMTWWRAERVRLALVAYELQNGEYPETLEALSPDFMAADEYRDPMTREPYGYAPGGFDLVTRSFHADVPYRGAQVRSVSPGTPMLWSAGTNNAKPATAWVSYRMEDDTRIETIVEEGEPKPEIDGEPAEWERVLVLRPQTKYWSWGAFWLPLPN